MNWEISQNVFVALLAIWLLFLLAGNFQMRRIKANTVKIVLEEAQKRKDRGVDIELRRFFAEISPIWMEMIPHSALFIPNKSEIFPVPARPEMVKKRINFTEEWVGAYLKMHDYPVLCTPEQKQKIDQILALRKQNPAEKKRKSEENPKA